MNCQYPRCNDGSIVGKKFCPEHIKTPFMTRAEVNAYRRGLNTTHIRLGPKEKHEENKKILDELEKAVKAPFSSAKIVFSIVNYGWQADIEIAPKGKKTVTGTVCRDWSDDGQSSLQFLDKLIEMGRTGKP